MRRWLAFLGERFSPVVYLLIAGGFLAGGYTVSDSRPAPLRFVLCGVGVFLFFLELRLMDEVKDLPKDAVIHPERPLPRGLIAVPEARRAVVMLAVAMAVLAAALMAVGNTSAGALYLGIEGYLLLTYKEFFRGAWLGSRPFLYALAHQPVGFLLALEAVAVFRPAAVLTRTALGWALAVLGGLFAYEICRKLDPDAPAELGYYVERRGVIPTSLALLACLAAVAAGAALARALRVVAPAEAILVAAYLRFLARLKRFALVETLGGLVLFATLWGPFLERILPFH